MITRRPSSSFTLADVCPRWRVSPEVAEEFLRDFTAAGYLTKVARDRWRVTRRGHEIARVVASLDHREVTA